MVKHDAGLVRLQRAGWVGLLPATQDAGICLPCCGVAVPAGFPLPGEGYQDGALSIDHYLISDRAATVLVRARGDAMRGAQIVDGDLLVVERGRTPCSGDIVLAVLEGEFTLRRLWQEGGRCWLKPANAAYAVVEVRPEQEFEIFGVVCGLARKY